LKNSIDSINRKLQGASEGILKGLIAYEQLRRNYKISLVGQFLDSDGISSKHYGVFGVSIWIICIRLLQSDENESLLESQCLEALDLWINTTGNHSQNEEYLLGNNLKIIIALNALLLSESHQRTKTTLVNRLLINQNPDGGWGYIKSGSTGSNSVVSSLVVRILEEENNCKQEIETCIRNFIVPELEKSELLGSYESLFILNNLYYAASKNSKIKNIITKKDIRRKIKNNLINIISLTHNDPTLFPNPCILDYHYKDSTEYYRLPPNNLILIESLANITKSRLAPYLNAYIGKRTFKKFIDSTKSAFDKDLASNRESTGSIYYSVTLIKYLESRRFFYLPLISNLYGWISYAFLFGVNLYWNLIVLVISLSLIFIVILIDISKTSYYNMLMGALLGLALKALVDIIKDIRQLFVIPK